MTVVCPRLNEDLSFSPSRVSAQALAIQGVRSLLTLVYYHLFFSGESKTELDTLDGVQRVLRKEGMIPSILSKSFFHLPTLHLITQPRMLLALFAARTVCWLMLSSICQDAQGLFSKAAPSSQVPAGTTAGGLSFPGAGPCTCPC